MKQRLAAALTPFSSNTAMKYPSSRSSIGSSYDTSIKKIVWLCPDVGHDRAMRVHHLNTATMCPPGARFVNGHGSLFRPGRLVCHVLLVELRDGLALVDGGIGLGDIADPARLGQRWLRQVRPRLDPSETAFEQVRARGFAPEDVRHIVLTHLDLDHAGCVPDFPAATVHVHANEIAAA